MIAAVDSGPLIALAKIRALDLLCDLYGQVFTGPAVYTECVTAGLAMEAPDAAVLQEAYQYGHLVVRVPASAVLTYPAGLHDGEAESIRLAIELSADWLLMDDLDARRIAQRNILAAGISTGLKGTLGVIVTAACAGVIRPGRAAELVGELKNRRDVWLDASLCDATIKTLLPPD